MTLALKVRVSTSSRSTTALALRKGRNAAAKQHRVDPGPVLVDQTQRIAARGIRWASHGGRAAVPPLPHTSR